ncbi:hypothetical protein BLNAU_24 [Blattamonas nauphoetae]|uniref:Uncharacterized protein n=1 Tax=Blattamonas nauphoetae TaxID=2049346 RepID=A0ABQ9YLT2_9EUKA|nr:hypothetical protein BLNAU_24 [Blattamonas nauphoetae]
MYQGVGLTTPRGTATNGYVRKNLAFVQTSKFTEQQLRLKELYAQRSQPPPSKELLKHENVHEFINKYLEAGLSLEEIQREYLQTPEEVFSVLPAHHAPKRPDTLIPEKREITGIEREKKETTSRRRERRRSYIEDESGLPIGRVDDKIAQEETEAGLRRVTHQARRALGMIGEGGGVLPLESHPRGKDRGGMIVIDFTIILSNRLQKCKNIPSNTPLENIVSQQPLT